MKVLITGANGFLAANIIRELNKRNVLVRGMVRKTSNLLSLKTADYEKVTGELNSLDDIKRAAIGCDIIIHAAANTSQNTNSNIFRDNIDGTENIIMVCELLSISKLIFVSSANTFGFGTIDNPGDESRPMNSIFKESTYALSKYKAQEAVLKANSEGRIKAVIVNPSFMIGGFDTKPSSGKILTSFFKNPIAICPPGGKNFVHVKDVAVAICNSIAKDVNGQCYLLTGQNLTYREFYRKVSVVSGNKKIKINFSKYAFNVLGYFGSFLNKIGFNTPLNVVNTKILSIDTYYTAEKAIDELQMPISSIESAINDAIDWFSENKYIKVIK